MTREEEITNAALEECAEQILDCKWAFMDGARWADEHPQKGLVNIDKACEWLKQFDAYRLCLEGHKDYFIEQFRKAMEE